MDAAGLQALERCLDGINPHAPRVNAPMLEVCDRLAFTRHPSPDDPGVVEVRLAL